MRRLPMIRMALIVLGMAAIAIVMVLVELPFCVTAYGRLVPANEWTLERGNNGQLIATLRNNVGGTCEAYNVSNPSGGSRLSFVLNEDILRRGYVHASDTLGYLHLSDVEERLIELQGDLEVTRATLAAEQTGEKKELVDEAVRKLELAEAESSLKGKIAARMAALSEKDLVSLEEYEIAEGEAELLQLEVQVARAQLEVVKTGAKHQQVDLLRTRVKALERQIIGIQMSLASTAIVSPVAGRLSCNLATDTLLQISDTTVCAALVPVKLGDYRYATAAREIDVSSVSGGVETTARIIGWDRSVRVVGGQETVVVSARLTTCPEGTWSGMIVMCDIPCGSVTVLEYLKRFLESSVG